MLEPSGEHPALPVSMALVEARDMVNDAESAQLGADCCECTMADGVLVRDWFQYGQKLVRRPFQFYEDGEKHALVRLVSRKQYLGKFIEPFHSGDSVVIEVYFCAWSHLVSWRPALLCQIQPFSMGHVIMSLLKSRRHEKRFDPTTGLRPKTVRFRWNGAQLGTFMAGTGQRHRFYIASADFRFGRLGG